MLTTFYVLQISDLERVSTAWTALTSRSCVGRRGSRQALRAPGITADNTADPRAGYMDEPSNGRVKSPWSWGGLGSRAKLLGLAGFR